MGAQFVSARLDINVEKAKAQFERMQQDDLYENGHSYSGGFGMARGLRIHSTPTFQTDQEASDWLEENTHKWEEAKAVRVEKPGPHLFVGAWCSS